MTLGEKLTFKLNDKEFQSEISKLRLKLDLPEKGLDKSVDFYEWNKTFSEEGLAALVTRGTVVSESSAKKFNELKVAESQRVKLPCLNRKIEKILALHGLPTSVFEILFNYIVYDRKELNKVGKNYKARLSLEQGIWKLFVEIGGYCKETDIQWKKDIKPLQKLLSDFSGNERPLEDLKDYQNLQKRINSIKKVKIRKMAVDNRINDSYQLEEKDWKKTINKEKAKLKSKNNLLKKVVSPKPTK